MHTQYHSKSVSRGFIWLCRCFKARSTLLWPPLCSAHELAEAYDSFVFERRGLPRGRSNTEKRRVSITRGFIFSSGLYQTRHFRTFKLGRLSLALKGPCMPRRNISSHYNQHLIKIVAFLLRRFEVFLPSHLPCPQKSSRSVTFCTGHIII